MDAASDLAFFHLELSDLDVILDIEQQVYAHPWSMGNFVDCLHSAYPAFGLREQPVDNANANANANADAGVLTQKLIAYYVLMPVIDEVHLLNLAVRSEKQGQGYARYMLDRIADQSREQAFLSVLLEVRVSNIAAIKLYSRYGFAEIGLRKAYYPAANNTRENALVMRLEL